MPTINFATLTKIILCVLFHIWIQFSGHDLPSTEQAVTELPLTTCTIHDVSLTQVHTTSKPTDDGIADSSDNLSPTSQIYGFRLDANHNVCSYIICRTVPYLVWR